MANLGMTIFEHLIRQEAQKQADFERQKAMDRERSMQDTEMLQRAVEHKLGREDKEFERQYKMAELMGKYSGMGEAEQAPQMRSPELQEMADTAFMGGQVDREGLSDIRQLKQMEYERKLRDTDIRGQRVENQRAYQEGVLGLREEDQMNDYLLAKERLANQQKHWAAMEKAHNYRISLLGASKYKELGNVLNSIKQRASSASQRASNYPRPEFIMQADEHSQTLGAASAIVDALNSGRIDYSTARTQLVELAPEFEPFLPQAVAGAVSSRPAAPAAAQSSVPPLLQKPQAAPAASTPEGALINYLMNSR